MSDESDVFTEHYRLLQTDPAERQRLIDDPVAGMRAYYGHVPEGDYALEVIAQEPDKITIVLPCPPKDGNVSEAAIAAASRRIYDILFTDGVGGYLIPDADLMWVLRDMRAATVRQHGLSAMPETE